MTGHDQQVVIKRLKMGHVLTTVKRTTANWREVPNDRVRIHLLLGLEQRGLVRFVREDAVRERIDLTDAGRVWDPRWARS